MRAAVSNPALVYDHNHNYDHNDRHDYNDGGSSRYNHHRVDRANINNGLDHNDQYQHHDHVGSRNDHDHSTDDNIKYLHNSAA